MIHEFETYMANVLGYSPCTCRAYASDLRQLATYAKTFNTEIRWSTLTPGIVECWLGSMITTHDARSIRRKASAVRSLYNWFWHQGKIASNWMRYIKAPKAADKLPGIISTAETNNMLGALASDPARQTEYAILSALYRAGLRFSEARNLRRADVDFSALTLRVDGKGKRERLVPMAAALADVLERYDGRRPSGRVFFFAHPSGAQYNEDDFRKIIHNTMADYTEASHAHALRHRFATSLAEGGTDLATIGQLLGHKQIKTTSIYINLAARAKRAAVNAL